MCVLLPAFCAVGKRLLERTDRGFTVVSGRGWGFRVARAAIFSFVGKRLLVPLFTSVVPKWVSQIGIRYRKSPISVSNLPGWGANLFASPPLAAGDRLPFLKGLKKIGGDAASEPSSTFDILRGKLWWKPSKGLLIL